MVTFFTKEETRMILENYGFAHSKDHTWRLLRGVIVSRTIEEAGYEPVELDKVNHKLHIRPEELAKFLTLVKPPNAIKPTPIVDLSPIIIAATKMARDRFREACKRKELEIDEDFVESMYPYNRPVKPEPSKRAQIKLGMEFD